MSIYKNTPPVHATHDVYNWLSYFEYIPRIPDLSRVAPYATLAIGVGALCFLFKRCLKKAASEKIDSANEKNTLVPKNLPQQKKNV